MPHRHAKAERNTLYARVPITPSNRSRLKAHRTRDLILCHRCHDFAEKSSKIVLLGAPLFLVCFQSSSTSYAVVVTHHWSKHITLTSR